MRVMIVGSLAGDLGRAATMAAARGTALEQADTPAAAMERMRADGRFGLVFCELGHDIAWLLARLAAERMRIPVVACARDATPDAAADAIRIGASEFLPLPPDPDLIAAILEAVVAGGARGLVARDPAMLRLLRRAETVAASNASVLITGESGTGKEVLARRLHERSRRAGKPFIAVNCAAIPDALLESELFGHEKGAFSGALARRIGKFEAAHGGTLLLDEVSEMDARLQAKLLRALQEREIDRLGGSSPVTVDVRVLATSNRDMDGEIAAGRFRADLFYRLNVVTFLVPPLRERPGDIAALATHYADRYAELNGAPRRRLAAASIRALEAHRWPGNVREIENTMHRAVLLAEGDTIEPAALELERPATATAVRAAAPELTEPDRATADRVDAFVGRSMNDVEQALIIGTLRRTLGNRTHAATILGISIRALRNKLRDYARDGVDVPAPASGIAA